MKKTLILLVVGILLGSTATFAAASLFPDVPSDSWYSKAVNNLSAKEIITGYPNGSFGPTNNVNRAELAVILDRLLEYVATGSVSSACSPLVEAEFKLAIRDFWNVKSVIRDPLDCNKFYYMTNDGSGSNIWVYDLEKDSNYKTSGSFNIPQGNTLLYNEQLSSIEGIPREFRLVDVIDQMIIFVETSVDDSPGPCFSAFVGYQNRLHYIDSTAANPVKKSYTVPNSVLISEQAEVDRCQEAL